MSTACRLTPPTARPDGLADPSDGDLLGRFARDGDPEAFEALVRRHGPRVLGVCRRVLRDDHAAEDAFQATFLVLARKAGSIDRPDALAGWLYGVAVRVARKARHARPQPLPAELPAATAVPDLDHRDVVRVLDEELGRLPPADRELVVLVYLDGRTHADAARAVGCPAGSVAWRLSRVRAVLRTRLVRRGVALAVGVVLMLAWVGAAQAVPEPLVRRTVAAARPRRRRRVRDLPRADERPADSSAGGRRARNRVVVTVLTVVVLILFGGGLLAALDPPRPSPGPADPPGHRAGCH